MSGIIKRRKTADYAQIHNAPLQDDLNDLKAIGLLAHLMSLPVTWEIHKTQLQKKFTRRTVDSAWSELAEKSYVIGFDIYENGKKHSYYAASDIPFTAEEYNEYIQGQIKEIKIKYMDEGKPLTLKAIKPMQGNAHAIDEEIGKKYSSDKEKTSNVQNVHKSKTGNFSNVRFVQYILCSTKRTPINKVLEKKILEKKILKNNYIYYKAASLSIFQNAKRKKPQTEAEKQAAYEKWLADFYNQPKKPLPFYNWLED